MTAGIGHNLGPSMDGGVSWRTHAWTRARADLLPNLPIEVVRSRVRRAAELGLPYKTYASFRAQTGNDLIGFLFSTNALDMLRKTQLEASKAAKLDAIRGATRSAIVQTPLNPETVHTLRQIDRAHTAPRFTDSWSAIRTKLQAILQTEGKHGDSFMLVGETSFERDWVAAGRIGGFLTGAAFFGPTA